jgi:hypothetical protein
VAGVTLTRPDGKAASVSRPAVGASVRGTPNSSQFLSLLELRPLAALPETGIPADAHSPGAVAAGVYEFLDDIVAGAGSNGRGSVFGWLEAGFELGLAVTSPAGAC